MEKNINLPLYKADKYNMPLVIGCFKGASGKVNKGLFLIDTGSLDNVLSRKAAQFIGDESIKSGSHSLTAIEGKGEDCRVANLNFMLDGKDFTGEFCISQSLDFKALLGLDCVIGILGSRFLYENGLALDCASLCLRGSDIENVMINDDTFLCSMEYGFNTYGIPLVTIANGKENSLFVADSGCNQTTISQSAIGGAIEYEPSDVVAEVTAISGTRQAKCGRIKFSLHSMSIGKDRTKFIETQDDAYVLSCDYVDAGDNSQKPPLSGLLSFKFMMTHKWVLDFKIGFIYDVAA